MEIPKLCLALDSSEQEEIDRLVEITSPYIDVLKVGLTAFATFGPPLVARLARHRPVFLDLKLHDIPAQVGGAIRAIAATGASYTTVHAFGGSDMLRAAREAASLDLSLLAVTVLTSLDDAELTTLGLDDDPEKSALRLADLALSVGVSGLVCSPQEIAALRTRYGPRPEGPLLVVPGIRPRTGGDDQRRTLGPGAAAAAGADLLVIGRPITSAEDPAEAARSIKEEMIARG